MEIQRESEISAYFKFLVFHSLQAAGVVVSGEADVGFEDDFEEFGTSNPRRIARKEEVAIMPLA